VASTGRFPIPGLIAAANTTKQQPCLSRLRTVIHPSISNMLMSTLSRLLSAWFAFLLPCFATYKALSRRPFAEPDIQRWSMYWAVIGVFMAFEYVAEWTVSWLPFYWEFKTLFLLYLSLPQTQGSTYVYTTYLQPFLSRNEADMDAGIIAIQRNVVTFIQGKLSTIWEFFWTKVGGRTQLDLPASGSNAPQLSRLLSPDIWRSAMNYLTPSSASARPTSSRHNSNTSSASSGTGEPQAPSFPTPQHYE